MHPVTAGSNRHPVDRLHDLRAQIKALEAEEKEAAAAVSKLMAGAGSVGGDEYIATESIGERAGSIDAAKLAKDGIDVDSYRKKSSVVVKITLAKRVGGESE